MEFGYLAKWDHSDESITRLLIEKNYTQDSLFGTAPKHPMTVNAEDFPVLDSSSYSLNANEPYIATIVPISINHQDWGVLSLIGQAEPGYSTYAMFTNYIDMLASGIEKTLLEIISSTTTVRSLPFLNSTSFYQALSGSDGMWEWDLQRDTITWGDNALKVLGFALDNEPEPMNEDLGYLQRHVPFFQRIHPLDRDHIKTHYNANVFHDVPFRAQFRILNADNHYLWVEAYGETLRNTEGEASRFVGVFKDMTEHKKHKEKIKYRAFQDELTGVANRSKIHEQLGRHILSGNPKPLAVLIFHIKNTEWIIRNFDAESSDKLLNFISGRLKSFARQEDYFARYQNDQFIFLSEVNHHSDAMSFAERLLTNLPESFSLPKTQDIVGLQGCIGISIYPFHGSGIETLLKAADIALQVSSQEEPGTITVYSEELEKDKTSLRTLEYCLRQSIESNELFLMYQPQIDATTGKLIGVEVLLRWQSAEYGLINPLEFIPMAEESGQIELIGEWVLKTALKCQEKWRENGYQKLSLSINISAKQLLNTELVSVISENLQRNSSSEIGGLTLEIKESSALNNLELARQVLNDLAKHGVSLAVDDFGTGYSSLSLLNELPLEWVKVDRALIQTLVKSENNAQFLKAAIQMNKTLGYKTIAVGVETPEQLKVLKEIEM